MLYEWKVLTAVDAETLQVVLNQMERDMYQITFIQFVETVGCFVAVGKLQK